MSDDKDLAELERTLNDLQIENDQITRKQYQIRQDISNLKHNIREKRNKHIKARSTAVNIKNKHNSSINKDTKAKEPEVITDKVGNPLKVGDEVYICTKGAFKLRRGVLKLVVREPEYCIVLDEDGIAQSRIARNLLLETEDTRRFLH